MKQRYLMVISLGMLLAALFSASCQKPFHEETEHYILVATNINLEYWQDAGAGFRDAARGLGVKADFQGPTYLFTRGRTEGLQGSGSATPLGDIGVARAAGAFQCRHQRGHRRGNSRDHDGHGRTRFQAHPLYRHRQPPGRHGKRKTNRHLDERQRPAGGGHGSRPAQPGGTAARRAGSFGEVPGHQDRAPRSTTRAIRARRTI